MKNIILLILFVVITGCNKNENNIPAEKINKNDFRALVNRALDREIKANNRLGNLVDYSVTNENKYNSVLIDSLNANAKIFYLVLLENSNPMLNRFAVYDPTLTPLLIDKSLNGNIYFDKIRVNRKTMIKIDEAYLSKDTLVLNRVSLYDLSPEKVSLAFRTHTKFVKTGNEFYQDIIEITNTQIKTKISGSKKFSLTDMEDTFEYARSEMRYLSNQNLFDVFIKNEIESFDHTPVKKQIAN